MDLKDRWANDPITIRVVKKGKPSKKKKEK